MEGLTQDQRVAFLHLQGRSNVFLTGEAGTGKSFLIQEFLKTQKEEIPLLASTGTAALLLRGRTFHSFFGLGIMQGGEQVVFERACQDPRLVKRLRNVSTVVIDEISMISEATLNCAERIARTVRNKNEPWGRLRVIAVGDFAQLPPPTQGSLQKPWAFLSRAWKESAFKVIELKEFVRSRDQDFLAVLRDVRGGALTLQLKHFLNSHQVSSHIVPQALYIFPRRNQTEAFNKMKLSRIAAPLFSFPTSYEGEPLFVERLKREAPVPQVLELKKGASVMIRMNDSGLKYVNGTVGVVKELFPEAIVVQTQREEIKILPYTFHFFDADGKEKARARNFPLNLAWASTIHKVQGMTLGQICVDLSNLWESGQAYVALSRVQRSDHLSVLRWSPRSFRTELQVHAFYDSHGLNSHGLKGQETNVFRS